jgi:hypothetical protein
MKPRYFTLPLAYLGCLWLLLGALSAPAAQARSFYYNRIAFNYQLTKDYKADGSIVSAEFIFEATLSPDGRANGAWGMWERGTPDVLTLYRIVEGRVRSDGQTRPFFEFKSQRLSPLSEDEITINLRPAASQSGQLYKGQWTLTVQDAAARALSSFGAEGMLRPSAPSSVSPSSFSFSYINAPPQTVVVQTLRGSYTANFENVALVFPSGGAIGLLALAGADGRLQNFHVMAGETQSRNGVVGRVLLRARAVDTAGSSSPLPVLMVIADQQDFSEPCRIYDILGTQVGPAHFEAQASFTVF